ncbi:MAG: CapA family protein [Saccharospirillaceae bacterium]|nr:CapA family protein [Pseudomonadales bacterium]NRB79319.1 CapA family protein [Saccharospirillaceae bacterium]
MQFKKILAITIMAFTLLSGCQTKPVKTLSTQEVKKEQLKPQAESIIIELPKTKVLQPEYTIKLGFVGDIFLGGSAKPILEAKGYDYPFENVQPILDDSDILFGNLEGPLTNYDEIYIEKTYLFKSDPIKVSSVLKQTGFDIVSLANNHALDYGLQGMLDTKEVLDSQSVYYIGVGHDNYAARRAIVIEEQGIKVGYLAYNNTYPKEFWATQEKFGVAYGKQSEFIEDIQNLTTVSDIKVITFHWGREGETNLRDYQIEFAHAAIDAGADIVVGHHPHILQSVEKYKNGLILYSIGNFTFGTYGKLAQTSGIFNVEVSKHAVKKLEITGIDVFNQRVHFKPTLLVGEEMSILYESLNELSLERDTQLELLNNKIVLDIQ